MWHPFRSQSTSILPPLLPASHGGGPAGGGGLGRGASCFQASPSNTALVGRGVGMSMKADGLRCSACRLDDLLVGRGYLCSGWGRGGEGNGQRGRLVLLLTVAASLALWRPLPCRPRHRLRMRPSHPFEVCRVRGFGVTTYDMPGRWEGGLLHKRLVSWGVQRHDRCPALRPLYDVLVGHSQSWGCGGGRPPRQPQEV